jgi:hypothetical protein
MTLVGQQYTMIQLQFPFSFPRLHARPCATAASLLQVLNTTKAELLVLVEAGGQRSLLFGEFCSFCSVLEVFRDLFAVEQDGNLFEGSVCEKRDERKSLSQMQTLNLLLVSMMKK